MPASRHLRRRAAVRSVLAGAAAVACALGASGTSAAQRPSVPPPAFAASTSAEGLRIRTVVPGAPATDIPVDAGGPTAQAVVDSIGTSTAYAAFPAPGDLVISAPGLTAGLVTDPAGLPAPPDYPFYVHSDRSRPEDVLGAGPYSLAARSGDGSGEASALAGFRTSELGNAALVRSTTEIGPTDDGGVLARASSVVEALTVGPLTIGSVTSTVTQSMDARGEIQTSSSLDVTGARVAGIAVSITEAGLGVAGVTVPLPIGDTLSDVLSDAGLVVRFLESQHDGSRVLGPALQIEMPLPTSGVGSADGTMTLTLGLTSVQLTGADAFPPLGADEENPVLPPGAALGPAVGSEAAPGASQSSTPTATPSSTTMSDSGLARPASEHFVPTALIGLFDITSSYLMVSVAALATLVIGQLIRLTGVRRSWTSVVG